MRPINLSEVEEAQDFEKVTPGGYICGITAIEDVAEKEYLRIEYDIADGKLKNFYNKLYNSQGFWGGNFIRSYKAKALPFFKGFITAVEKSNSGYKWNNDEKTLVRKLVGLVLAEEEYRSNKGELKTRLYVAAVKSIDKIKSGDYKVPDLKKLDGSVAASTSADLSAFEEESGEKSCPF